MPRPVALAARMRARACWPCLEVRCWACVPATGQCAMHSLMLSVLWSSLQPCLVASHWACTAGMCCLQQSSWADGGRARQATQALREAGLVPPAGVDLTEVQRATLEGDLSDLPDLPLDLRNWLLVGALLCVHGLAAVYMSATFVGYLQHLMRVMHQAATVFARKSHGPMGIQDLHAAD